MTAQILSMHAPRSELSSVQTHFPQEMETSGGAAEPQTPVSPEGDDSSRGRRRDRREADGEDHADGADGADVPGGSRKRRRSRKGLDKKFECPHDNCGKSYSRAEHLYRHQLNRKCCTGQDGRTSRPADAMAQTTLSRSTAATSLNAIGPLCARTCVHATKRDTQTEARSCCAKTPELS